MECRFNDLDRRCVADVNQTLLLYSEVMHDMLNAARDVRSRSQRYLQRQVRRIHEVVLDLPIGNRNRVSCGILTDVLARVTGLASQDDLRGVKRILEQIETGVYEASRLWGDKANSCQLRFS